MFLIRPVTDPADYPQLEAIQREVWGADDLEILSARTMHALIHNGAHLHGAYAGETLVGFCFGVLGTVEALAVRKDPVAAARLKLYSVMMGVLPAYQGQGIGYQLKLAQREFADRIGVRLITWTYDPLESRNAWLNIGKLGCVSDSYLRDFHGELGGINAGLATDRFEVSWWITGSRAKSRTGKTRRAPLSLGSILAGGALLVNEAQRAEGGLVRPPESALPFDANLLLVEIPADFQTIKREDMALARAWRQHTRALFERAFAAGYTVTDIARETTSEGEPRAFYVLTQGTAWR